MDSINNAYNHHLIKNNKKSSIIYFTQVVLIYMVVVVCLINLSIGTGNQALWSSLLSGSLGYILPAPGSTRTCKRNFTGSDLATPPSTALDFPDSLQVQEQQKTKQQLQQKQNQ